MTTCGNTNRSLDSKPRKVENLWFDDGDVIIRVGNEEFRVRSDTLSAESTFFEEILCQGLRGLSKEEGWVASRTEDMLLITYKVPASEPSGNRESRDILSFLSAIFISDYYVPLLKVYPYFQTADILRIAIKYDARTLIRRASIHLDYLLPMNQDALKAIAESESEHTVPNKTMIETYLDLLPIVGCNPDTKWYMPSIVYLIINLVELSELMIDERLARLGPTFWIMILKCGINNVSYRQSGVNCMRMIPALEGCMNNSGEFGITSPSKCQLVVERYIEHLNEGSWNKHVQLCGFQTWNEVREIRRKALGL